MHIISHAMSTVLLRPEKGISIAHDCKLLVGQGRRTGHLSQRWAGFRMYEVWQYGAPCIDLHTPDIYVHDFCNICDEYTRRGKPLMIPECSTHSYSGPRMLYTVGHYHALCYAPLALKIWGSLLPEPKDIYLAWT